MSLGFTWLRFAAPLAGRDDAPIRAVFLVSPKEFPELEAAPEEKKLDYTRSFVESALQMLMASISGSAKRHDQDVREHLMATCWALI